MTLSPEPQKPATEYLKELYFAANGTVAKLQYYRRFDPRNSNAPAMDFYFAFSALVQATSYPMQKYLKADKKLRAAHQGTLNEVWEWLDTKGTTMDIDRGLTLFYKYCTLLINNEVVKVA